jgi:Holliday junction resolvasome RuvABC endonuclease subunit
VVLRLLTLDHASRTGWCCGDIDKRPAVGSRLHPHTGGEDRHEALWQSHRDWLTGLIRDFKPGMIAWEHPILAAQTSLASVMITCGLAAITGLVCRDMRVPCRTVTVGQAKIALTGRGNASKSEMVGAAELLGFKIAHHDEADALGVFVHVVRILAPAHAHRFDPLFMNIT